MVDDENVNCPCALVVVVSAVPLRVTGRLGRGRREVSSTRPVMPVRPPGVAPVTVTVIVSEEDALPSPAMKLNEKAPTCVVSGVKTNSPVSEWNDACGG